MVQIIPNNQKRSFGEQVLAGINESIPGIQQHFQQQQQRQQQEMQMQQAREAVQQLGLDPAILNLPEQGQAAYFKSKFAPEKQMTPLQGSQQRLTEERIKALQGGKQMTPLQESQQRLSEERLKALQSNQQLFQGLMNGRNVQDSQGKESDQKEGFDISKVPEEKLRQIAAFKGQPGIEGTLGNIAQSELDRKIREKKESPEFQRDQQVTKAQASADVKYNQTLQEASKQHELKEQTLDRLEKLNKKGVTGKPYEKLLEKAGLVALTSEGRREFAADVKNLITDIRSILGAQFTGFEFQTILNAYPSADFSKGANTSIIKNLKEFQDIKKKEVEFAQRLKKENGGKIPSDFQSKVNEMVRDYAASRLPEIKENTRKIMAEEYGVSPGNVLMLDPQGEPLDVSPSDVERYEALGATLP